MTERMVRGPPIPLSRLRLDPATPPSDRTSCGGETVRFSPVPAVYSPWLHRFFVQPRHLVRRHRDLVPRKWNYPKTSVWVSKCHPDANNQDFFTVSCAYNDVGNPEQ